MADLEKTLLRAFETHSVAGIEATLDVGFDVHAQIGGKSPINWLIEMYSRSDRFATCIQLMLARGARLDDPKIEAVLLDDPVRLEQAVKADPGLLLHKTDVRCAFTPLLGASLLHVAAEYGHLKVARKLIELGAAIDARAALDECGMNGHTPLFHTVCSNANRAGPVMRLLLEHGARPDVFLRGITWGKSFEWETVCFDVTPVSYSQLGLLPQMHREERHTYENIGALLQAAGRTMPPLDNVPNRYLAVKGGTG